MDIDHKKILNLAGIDPAKQTAEDYNKLMIMVDHLWMAHANHQAAAIHLRNWATRNDLRKHP